MKKAAEALSTHLVKLRVFYFNEQCIDHPALPHTTAGDKETLEDFIVNSSADRKRKHPGAKVSLSPASHKGRTGSPGLKVEDWGERAG